MALNKQFHYHVWGFSKAFKVKIGECVMFDMCRVKPKGKMGVSFIIISSLQGWGGAGWAVGVVGGNT